MHTDDWEAVARLLARMWAEDADPRELCGTEEAADCLDWAIQTVKEKQ